MHATPFLKNPFPGPCACGLYSNQQKSSSFWSIVTVDVAADPMQPPVYLILEGRDWEAHPLTL